MYEFITFIHVTVCLLLIGAVLLQQGKGAGLNMFGGGGDALFSAPTGSSMMSQITWGLAIVFASTALLLTLAVSHGEMRSVTSRVPMPPPVQSQPQTPAPAPSPAAPAPAAGASKSSR